MWDELSPADIERAKRRLAKRRSEMLRRHEEELNRLDIDQHEIEVLARLVHAFAKKHLVASVHEPTTSDGNPPQLSRAANFEILTHDGSKACLQGPSTSREISERLIKNRAGDTFSIASLIAMLNPGG